MLLLDRQKPQAPRHGDEPLRPQLRVKADGRLLDLPQGKTTIGSSPRCDIRIQQPGVQPLHLLIVCEGEAVRVRRWADNTRLNGQSFVEAPLSLGDCLVLGSVELEIVGSEERLPVESGHAAPAEVAATSGLRRGRDLARQRSRRLIAALRQSRSIKNELSQRVTGLCEELAAGVANRERVSRELQEASAALEDSRKWLIEYQSQLAANHEVSARNDQLSREVNELLQLIAASNQDQAAAEVEGRSLREEISRLGGQIAEADQRYAVACVDRDEIRRRNEELVREARELQQRVSALDESRARAEADQESLRNEIARLENQATVDRECHTAVCGEREAIRQQNEELQNTISQLQQRIDALNGEQTQAEAERWKYREEVSRWQEQAAQAEQRQAAICTERDDECRRNEDLRRQLSEVQERIAESAGEQSRAEVERTTLREEIARLQEQYAQADQRHAEICGERDMVRRHNEELIRQFGELQQRIEVLAGEQMQLEAARQALQHENSGLADECRRLSSEIAESRTQADQRHADICGERDGVRRHNEELIHQVSALQHRIEVLAGEQMQLEAARQAMQHENAGLSDECRRLGEEIAEWRAHAAESDKRQSAVFAERDELRRQNDQLQVGIAAVSSERDSLAADRDHLAGECDEVRRQKAQLASELSELRHEADAMAVAKLAVVEERDALRREVENLRASIEATSQEIAVLATTKSELVEECERLRPGAAQIAELERKVQEATTERENTCGELYRALLQLAEMRSRDEQHVALTAAHEALNAEFEKSAQEVAQLQVQLDRLMEERESAEAARQSLIDETAAHEEIRRQLAEENTSLVARLAELQNQIRDQTRQKWESNARLLEAESLGEQLCEARGREEELAAAIAQLQSEAIEKDSAVAAAMARTAECERQLADQAQTLAEAAERQMAMDAAMARIVEFEQQIAEQARQLADAAKTQQALDAAVARAADCEQQLADQAQRFAESGKANQRLEEQVTRLAQERTDFDRARQEWTSERAAAERQMAEQSQRLVEAEQSIRQLEERIANLGHGQNDIDGARQEWLAERADAERQRVEAERQRAALTGRIAELETQLAAAKELAAAPTNSIEPQAAPAEFDWSSVRTTSAASCAMTPEKSVEEGGAAPVTGAERPVWGGAAEGHDLQQKSSLPPTTSAHIDNRQTTASFNGIVAEAKQPTEKQPARSNESDAPPASTAPTESYIQRYAHLFQEDDAESVQPSPLRQSPELPSNRPSTSGQAMAGQSQRPSGSDDEESIEQYMAKLLQRVRGDGPLATVGAAAPVQVAASTSYGNSPAFGVTSATVSEPTTESQYVQLEQASAVQPNAESVPPQTENIGPRWSSSPAPATDLRSLRALANETARRAIGTHELRKHRRNMVTQIIVSMLAGVTSLWLMLESSDWLTVQFVIACMSLVVAAYWAGQTYRTLLESFRVAAFDRPEMTTEDEQPTEDSGLPIDVDE
jgi:chromosome segregation ATPase